MYLQMEMQKRIFCNFYGCGSKRSGTDTLKPIHMPINQKDSESDENLRDTTYANSMNYPEGSEELIGNPEVSSYMEDPQFMRVVAALNSLKSRLQMKVPRRHRRQSS